MSDSPVLRFLCDVMLARLARWLRAAGHDALLADARATDAAIVRQAVEEGRLLLTLDRGIEAHAAGRGQVLVLPQATLAEQARWLKAELALDWLARPFSRCLVDNTLLVAAETSQIAHVPPPARLASAEFRACPACGRVYWPGSHHRRMQAVLDEWAAGGRLTSSLPRTAHPQR